MIQVIQRAAAILRTMESHPEGRTLAELAREVDLPRSTVHRIVKALQAEHLVASVSAESGFRLGPAMMRLASSSRRWLVEHTHDHLLALSRSVNETVDLSVRSGDRVLFVDQIAVSHRLQALSGVGVAFPLHCTANGKALLAELPADEVEQLLSGGLDRHTDHTITDLDVLLRELDEVRVTRVAFDREEHHLGICAVGTTLGNPNGLPAALSIPVPASRFAGREHELSASLLATRAAIEASFSSTGHPG